MISNLSHTAWIDIFDDKRYEETGEALLFRNPIDSQLQPILKCNEAILIYSLQPGVDCLFNKVPIAQGFTAYIGHDEVYPGFNSLKSNIQSGRKYYTQDYYRNYSVHLYDKFKLQNDMLPCPLVGIELELAFYHFLVQNEIKYYKASKKYFTQCIDVHDQTLKNRLHEYSRTFLTLIQSKLSELEANTDAVVKKAEYTQAELSGIIPDVIKHEQNEESGQPIRGIRALAKFLGVGVNTAQKLKNERIIPYFQNGRIVLFDRIKVKEALAEYNIRKHKKQ